MHTYRLFMNSSDSCSSSVVVAGRRDDSRFSFAIRAYRASYRASFGSISAPARSDCWAWTAGTVPTGSSTITSPASATSTTRDDPGSITNGWVGCWGTKARVVDDKGETAKKAQRLGKVWGKIELGQFRPIGD
uniref:Uncharacterized protein n=1 Tax=Anopheles coluzzii TaxID=1518534 RepID=A0A8W7PKY4_ANOCL